MTSRHRAPLLLAAGLASIACGCVGSSARLIEPSAGTPTALASSRFEVGSVSVKQAGPPEDLAQALERSLRSVLAERGMLALPGDAGVLRIDVEVASFRIRGYVRLLGLLAGPDRMESTATVVDPRSGAVVGRWAIRSHNATLVHDVANLHAQRLAVTLRPMDKE